MSLKFGLVIFVFSLSAFADEGHVIERPEIVRVEISAEPLTIELPRFVFRDGGRHWSAQELEPDNINQSFSTWLECYQNPGKPECNNCESHSDENVFEIARVAVDRCLPPQSDMPVAYAANLTENMKAIRDNEICACYRRGNAGPLGDFAFTLGTDRQSRDAASRNRDELRRRRESLERGLLSEQTRRRLMTERFQTSFSAGSYSENAGEALALAAIYSTSEPGHESRHAEVAHGAQSLGARSGAIAAGIASVVEVASREVSESLATSDDFTSATILSEPGFCVPYRHFLASKQYPNNPDFFADLDRQNEFNWEEWNYPRLVEDFNRMVGDRTINEALSQDTEGGRRLNRVYNRIKFLYDNPVFRNVFQSGRRFKDTKVKLKDLIRGMPRPGASPQSLADYRRRMNAFLREENTVLASRDGAENNHATQIQIAVESARQNAGSSDNFMGPNKQGDFDTDWRTFCDERDVQRTSRDSSLVRFILDLESSMGRRNFEDPRLDEEYREMNAAVCTEPRTGPRGSKTFQQFFAEVCRNRTEGECSIEGRADLVGRFMTEYSNSNSAEGDKYSHLIPVLGGSGKIASFSSGDVQTYNSISRDPVLSRSIATLEGIPSGPTNTRTTDANLLRSTQPESQALVNPAQNPGMVQPQQQIIIPQAQPQASPEPQKQRAIAETESAAQSIRNELSSLRQVLSREPSEGGPRDSGSILDINRRIASLEERLIEKEEELANLRRRASTIQNTSPEASVAQAQISSPERPRNETSQTIIVPQSGAAGGSVPGAPVINSASTFAGVNSPQVAGVSARASGNSALLSKYGVRETSEQGGITVSQSPGSIDYQQLRSETENSILPLTVTAEEFTLISQNNQGALSRYFDQLRALPGEVVRINLSSGERSMELYVRKSGDQISFVPTQRSRVQRLPASDPDRATLQNLRNEFVQ